MRKDLTDLRSLTARHIKLYFKDKQTFFMSLITPLILVVLFATFLRSVYVSTLTSALPDIEFPDKLVNGFVAGWLISSILGVSSVTLAFCSQTVMVSDKAKKRIDDFLVAPVKSSVLSWSYFLATIFSTLLVCLVCLAIGFVYIAACGWYLTAADVLLILGNLVLCAAFGALLAVIVETFLKTDGAAGAAATIASSMYGFLCGAYMPISQFAAGIRNFVMFIPGTYGTVLFRRFFMGGAVEEIAKYAPAEAVSALRDAFDYNLYFFGNSVSPAVCFAILGGSVVLLAAAYYLIVHFSARRKKRGKLNTPRSR